MTPPKPQPSADSLRNAALACIDAANRLKVLELRAEYIDEDTDQRVEVTVAGTLENVYGDDGEGDLSGTRVVDQRVTVKVGAKTAARTIIAAPAEWVTT